MLVSKLTEEDLTLETVDRLLFRGLEDKGDTADCIIVLGSLKAVQYRLPVAHAAYKAGRAGKFLLCGGKLRDFPDGKRSEAEQMHRALLELGVPEEDILLENSSMNTVENLRNALTELERAFTAKPLRSVLLVTTAYHMRRSLAIARHLFPAEICVFPCPANDTNTKRENWMHTPVGTARAKTEAMKIVRYALDGLIPDFEI